MYEVKQFKSRRSPGTHQDQWIWVRISRKEAADLIRSLSMQLRDRDPNSGRIEAQWCKDSKTKIQQGYLSIAVQEDPHCLVCGEEIKPFTGKPYEDGLLCPKCAPGVCDYCQHLHHTKYCMKPRVPELAKLAVRKKKRA